SELAILITRIMSLWGMSNEPKPWLGRLEPKPWLMAHSPQRRKF
ncbi:MAG: hypothetical protein EZS28_021457, partial [Streblomastix strix]